jgi:hypothetical protein
MALATTKDKRGMNFVAKPFSMMQSLFANGHQPDVMQLLQLSISMANHAPDKS